MLLEQAGVPGPVLALPDAVMRVWIEDKYRSATRARASMCSSS